MARLLVSILTGYVFLVCAHVAYVAFPGGEVFRERRGFALQHVLRVSRPLLSGHGKELDHYLRDAESTGLIDYYEAVEKGRTETGGVSPPKHPVLTEAVSDNDGWIWGRAEGGDITLRLANGYGWHSRLRLALGGELDRLPFDITFLVIVFVFSFAYQGSTRREAALGAVSGGSRRARAKAARAEAPRARVAGSENGDFSGVCGRASVLNQAELAQGDPEKFFSSLEEFYADCSAIVSRYKGKLHGMHGHELVFYFHEKDSILEARLALAAARDLEEVASRRGFRVATALSHGRLHGANLLSGFALFGAPVEETSDLIQALSSGARENAIWVTESVVSLVGSFATFRSAGGGAKKLHARSLISLPPVGPALDAARVSGAFSELSLHRSDAAIAEMLRTLAKDSTWDRDHYVGVITELRRVHCRRCGPAVVDAYRTLLEAELARKDTYRLSSVVALAATLLSRSLVDRALEKMFFQAIAGKDRRVRANAVELFTKFFPDREMPELRPLIRDEDNRVSANALIKAACERFDEKVIARLDERVRGGSVAHVASALHAMGEIALHYRRHDPLFLGTKHNFLRLFDGVPGWVGHPNTMIRRQAMIAAHKLQSEPIDARLREIFTNCMDPELVGLFSSVYGWRKESTSRSAA